MVGAISRGPLSRARLAGARSGGAGLWRSVGYVAIDRFTLGILADDLAASAAKLFAALPRLSKRGLGSGADHAGLQLGDGHHLLQKKPAGGPLDLRQVGKAQIHASDRVRRSTFETTSEAR
jgi:hypothetical protein